MNRLCLSALGALLSTVWLAAQEPPAKEVFFDIYPAHAVVRIPTDRAGWDNYPVGQKRLVTFPSKQFDMQIVAEGWKPLTIPLNQNQIGQRWPPVGTQYLEPDSFSAQLQLLPRWPLLVLLMIPLAVRRTRTAPAPAPTPATAVEPPKSAKLPWELGPGCRVDGYIVQERLGEGASGVVYRVLERDSNVDFALKLLKPQSNNFADSLPRFRREMKVLCQLKHPNIPYLADVGEFAGMSYLVMELLGPITLEDKLRPGPFPPERAKDVLCQLTRALAFCHLKGILHRDIKPENVIWGDNGQRVRLTDFGLARHNQASTLTQEGSIMGTPCYMAPEIVQGLGASEASDQYSLGCLAYQMVTGAPPFTAENPMVVLMNHIDKAPAPLTQVSPGFAHAILKMLCKKPEERFPSMAQLLERLEKIVA
ncbi:serine/threonine protein kinase [bacterium]|nr:serine/threonine protein kinase [bacterium]